MSKKTENPEAVATSQEPATAQNSTNTKAKKPVKTIGDAVAEKLMEKHHLTAIWQTADGQYFAHESDALHHAATLKRTDVKKYNAKTTKNE